MLRGKIKKVLISLGVITIIGVGGNTLIANANTLNSTEFSKAFVNKKIQLKNETINKFEMVTILKEAKSKYKALTQYGVTCYIPKEDITLINSGEKDSIVKLKEKGKVINVKTVLNVRKNPDINDNVIATIKEGAIVSIIGRQGSWLKIDMNGVEGFVYNSFIESNPKTMVKKPKKVEASTLNNRGFILLTYQTLDGKILEKPVILNGKIGSSIEIKKRVPKGYKLLKVLDYGKEIKEDKVKFTDLTQNIVFKVQKINCNVNVTFKNGNNILDVKKYKMKIGENISNITIPKNLENYTINNILVNGKGIGNFLDWNIKDNNDNVVINMSKNIGPKENKVENGTVKCTIKNEDGQVIFNKTYKGNLDNPVLGIINEIPKDYEVKNIELNGETVFKGNNLSFLNNLEFGKTLKNVVITLKNKGTYIVYEIYGPKNKLIDKFKNNTEPSVSGSYMSIPEKYLQGKTIEKWNFNGVEGTNKYTFGKAVKGENICKVYLGNSAQG